MDPGRSGICVWERRGFSERRKRRDQTYSKLCISRILGRMAMGLSNKDVNSKTIGSGQRKGRSGNLSKALDLDGNQGKCGLLEVGKHIDFDLFACWMGNIMGKAFLYFDIKLLSPY